MTPTGVCVVFSLAQPFSEIGQCPVRAMFKFTALLSEGSGGGNQTVP